MTANCCDIHEKPRSSCRYRHSCRHDPVEWTFRSVRGHDPRTGYVHYYLEVICNLCEERRVEIRKQRNKKRRIVGV